ncbi:DUF4249 domain-containing protein [uncultured Chitinophaga sp.]|uniref:DUF4249 domain-containing protein n=1 Tax=uncultured Chitinophaga sp. TaxID=339340 RepID=UPI0025EA610C|nr:DUF4249 domain-containing protein [uncultured Chitinophaga sp.]
MMRKITLLIISAFLFTSCLKTVDMDLPYDGDKIVVNAFMQVDSVVYIRVTKSEPPGSNSFTELDKATVSLFENDQEIPVTRKVINGLGYFVSARQIKYGYNYKVKATADNLTAVSAVDSLPQQPMVGLPSGFVGGNRIQFKLQDRAGFTDYYRFRIYLAEVSGGRPVPVTPLKVRFDPSYNNEFIDIFSREYYVTNIISDERFSGSEVNVVMQTENPLPADQYLVVEVTALTPTAFKYLKSLQYQGANVENPLVEPATVFSNVTGGYGIVAGINSTRVPFKAN